MCDEPGCNRPAVYSSQGGVTTIGVGLSFKRSDGTDVGERKQYCEKHPSHS
ncbi:hypothetical protein SEA_BEEGEE_33 [Gordonia phage BeeGee]|nr:hypothetical protein SEA_BEEGEE_33 [Gordonia phage BeeGee]